MVSKNEKSLGLKEQINHIDTQINDLKKLVENNIAPEIRNNTEDLKLHIKRTNTLEDFVFDMSQQFQTSNRLMITQTAQLTEAIDKVKNEIKDQTNQNQNLIKKSAPIVALLTVLASIALEIFKYILK